MKSRALRLFLAGVLSAACAAVSWGQVSRAPKSPGRWTGQSGAPSEAPTDAMTQVIVWLEGEPLAAFHYNSQPVLLAAHRPFQMEEAAVRQHRKELEGSRRAVQERLSPLGFEAQGETDVVLHALIGRLPAENLSQAAALPGVRAVRPVQRYHKKLDGAIPLINAIPGWQLLGGESRAGRDMRVGVIDTGVDINNPMLQDLSLTPPSGFPKGDPQFTNNKVIVARSYVNLLGEPQDPTPPMDHEGHGTFVSAIAAGRRVVAPQAEIVGVAPGAFVGNYRVFSGPQFSDPLFGPFTNDAAVIAALNDAVADGMNVVNVSLGSFPLDLPSALPLGQAITNAARAGLLLVAAAGNDGPDPATISDPADSPEAIAVGASSNQRIFANALRVTGPGAVPPELALIAAAASDAPAPAAPLSLPVWAVTGNPCNTFGASEQVRTAIALMSSSTSCSTLTKVRNASNAGALAALIYRSDSEDPLTMTGLSTAAIPAFQLSRQDGTTLATFSRQAASSMAQVVIDSKVTSVPVQPDRIASFSSVGPDIRNELKPELTAPGTNIYSAMQINDVFGFFYNPAQFGLSDGTSFSTPMVAGAALLVKQLHPAWTPAQVKSALVNTAANVVVLGAQQAPLAQSGNGRLDVAAALRAVAAFEPQTLSFGSRILTAPLTFQRSFTITNLSSGPESFNLEVRPRSEISNGTVTVQPATTPTLQPRESTTVQVTFTALLPAQKLGLVDGRIRVSGVTSGITYALPYWGQVADNTAPFYLFYVRGRGQTQKISTTLAQNMVAVVTDSNFIALTGVTVSFSVTQGGGSLGAASVVTDFTGFASVPFTLGETAGLQQVQVKAVSNTGADLTGSPFTISSTALPNPAFTKAGLVHAASYTSAVAPGSIVSLFGTGLAAGTGVAAQLPLPTTVMGAKILVNGTPAPIFFASPRQINFQLPFEIEGQSTADLRVTVLSIPAPSVSFSVSAAAPGLFTTSQNGQGTVVALHGADSSAVSAQNPARSGETVVLYGTGLGPVTPTVPSGAASPSNPPAQTRTLAAVKVGGIAATVAFSGLAPGFVGLYQVNVQLPSGLSAGDLPLVLSIGSANSNPTTLPVR